VRQSKDEHSELFAIDAEGESAATSEGASTAETEGSSSQDVPQDLLPIGSSAPVEDVQSPVGAIETSAEDALTAGIDDTGDRASEAGSVTGGVSSVAPADSLNA
jgi:hypothetical protein